MEERQPEMRRESLDKDAKMVDAGRGGRRRRGGSRDGGEDLQREESGAVVH